MYSCSKKNSQTYSLRPHHGMCLAYFIGNGYSSGFTAHMQEMLDVFLKDIAVKLTVNTDEICSACPNNEKGICSAGEKVDRYDNSVLEACNLQDGQELLFTDFVKRVQEKVIEMGRRVEICGDCQWNEICENQPSRWEIASNK